MKKNIILLLIIIAVFQAFACTIGVASSEATFTNRPMLWKSRDQNPNSTNTLRYVENMTYKFVGVATPNENRVWMGVNEMGFALANSLANDLTVGTGEFNNGNLIYTALGLSANLAEFENYLNYLTQENTISLELRGNFVAFDAEGNTKVYEVNNDNYWSYEPTAAEPYMLRTNFSLHGGSANGLERYIRSSEIISGLVETNDLTVNSLFTKQMRDVDDPFPSNYALPWEYGDPTPLIQTDYSICRANTVSAVVIEGVEPGQDPTLSTMWVIMGNPFTSYALPLFPTIKPNLTNFNNISLNSPDLTNLLWSGNNSYFLDTSYFVKSNGFSLLKHFQNVENDIYDEFEDMKTLLSNNQISTTEIKQFINAKSSQAYDFSSNLYLTFTPNEDVDSVPDNRITAYPNPFHETLFIKSNSSNREAAKVRIYNLKGQLVRSITNDNKINGELYWDGKDEFRREVASGIYLISYEAGSYWASKKVIRLSN